MTSHVFFARLALLSALVVAMPKVVWPASIDPSDECDLAAAQAAKDTGVPIDLLLAITRVETGRGAGEPRPWPWTINANGTGNWYPTKNEAIIAAKAHQLDGTTSFDIGCFQLNMKWHGENFADLADMFDPDQNAAYAASFLEELYLKTGDWAAAVSAYHSSTPALAEAYLAKVKQVLNAPEASAPTPQPDETPLHENLFPLLQAGDPGSAGSIVPQFVSRGRFIGGNS